MESPLADVRVLDLSSLLPGPFATQMLADLGADVVKVEPPTGDMGRQVPGGLFEAANRNKRSIRLDLKQEDDHARCIQLARTADVVVEGFRPGVANRLGVGYDQIIDENPRVVYCSISGYGQQGPMSARAGHDLVFLAASGALTIPGHWGEPARRPGVPLSDLAASSYATIAILVALRDRDRTGRGTHLDVAIRDAALGFTSTRAGSRLDRVPHDTAHLYPANDLFRSQDGAVTAIAALEDRFVDRLRESLGDIHPELRHPRFDTDEGKHRHAAELHDLVTSAVASLSQPELLSRLQAADVPAEPLRSVEEAADQVRHRGIVQEKGDERHVVFPVLADGRPMGMLRETAPRDASRHDLTWNG